MGFILDDGKKPLDRNKVERGVWHTRSDHDWMWTGIPPSARIKLRYADTKDGASEFVKRFQALQVYREQQKAKLDRAQLSSRVRDKKTQELADKHQEKWEEIFAEHIWVDHEGLKYWKSEDDRLAGEPPQDLPNTTAAKVKVLRQEFSGVEKGRFGQFMRFALKRELYEVSEAPELPDEDEDFQLDDIDLDTLTEMVEDEPPVEDELPEWVKDEVRQQLLKRGVGSADALLDMPMKDLLDIKGVGQATADKLASWAQEVGPEDPDPLGAT